MRRGFLSAAPKRGPSTTKDCLAKTGNAQASKSKGLSGSHNPSESGSVASSSSAHSRDPGHDITLPAHCDLTTIYDDSPSSFIFQADHRTDSSPFFGYFPPEQKQGASADSGDIEYSMVLTTTLSERLKT